MEVPRASRYITTVFLLRLLWDTIHNDWSKSASNWGLTVTEEQVLWAVWLFDSCTVSEIARHLQRDKGTVSKCVFSLEENGLIVREPGADRRSYGFRITAEGNEIRENLASIHGSNCIFARGLRGLTEEEQKAFLDLLLKITKRIEGKPYTAFVVHNLSRIRGAELKSGGSEKSG
ncbi:MAG: winged helix-turn-helix transcriptional regulator [Firmicutes bacterium]|nr:winged helix-turn-helix transcriptional regulator [Bacillota bacterium]